MENNKSVMNVFNDIKTKENVFVLEINNKTKDNFIKIYNHFSNRLFFNVASNCGGIIIDNWIRLYGCGELDILNKNKLINSNLDFDVIVGEDICGGLFAIKNNVIYYFAPDTLKWESLDIYYSAFLNWLLNDLKGISQFYETFRWSNWKEFCKDIKINQGISFYPQLCFRGDIESRSKKIVSMTEIIEMNFELSKQIN